MSKRDPVVLLEDIMLAIQKISRYTSQMDHAAFLNDDLVVDAVARNLEIIGEAAASYRKSSGELIDRFPGPRLRVCEIALFTTTLVWILKSSGRLSSTTCPI